MSNFFVVNDREVAIIMGRMLHQKYYVHTSDKTGKVIYTFFKVKGIEHIYGQAKSIVENVNK